MVGSNCIGHIDNVKLFMSPVSAGIDDDPVFIRATQPARSSLGQCSED